jgi:hypothetical protein
MAYQWGYGFPLKTCGNDKNKTCGNDKNKTCGNGRDETCRDDRGETCRDDTGTPCDWIQGYSIQNDIVDAKIWKNKLI